MGRAEDSVAVSVHVQLGRWPRRKEWRAKAIVFSAQDGARAKELNDMRQYRQQWPRTGSGPQCRVISR